MSLGFLKFQQYNSGEIYERLAEVDVGIAELKGEMALLHGETDAKECEVAVEDLRRIFQEYASATDFRGYLRSCLCVFSREFWFKKKWRLLVAFLIIGLIACVVYWDSLVSWMSEEGNKNAVFTLAGIAGIIASIATPIITVILGRRQPSR